MILWKKLLGILAVTIAGVLLELIYVFLSRTGASPNYRVQVKPTVDLF